MPAPISVVIPTLNAATTLSDTLEALVEGLDAGLVTELIVSDGGSEDATKALADAWGGTVIDGAPSRGGQLRRGCAAARAPWILVLHADTVLEPGWTDAVRAHLTGGQAGYFQLRFDRGGRWVAGWANRRARWFGLPYGDQGLLLPRTLYDRVGGYRDIPLMEDVAMARALKGQMQPLEAVARTSAARYRAQGWVRRGARNLWLLAQFLMGADADRLAARYRR
ncbi:TIGR04283 family arsenosugar biosynthesis glycosyltransferase [uncultured Tateyamaria sp.]|uniref:TIGR04283 family arsenosugar biosynthesis glycosyltransferase n=1 Tax=Tateyamaria sp. 1078 TaxID=3417464 RepID=UPI002616498C|nr:TIGR04283 family arsenosugar biosynthesis glycosyltransferase [uncultured Tateyamaria sp.]